MNVSRIWRKSIDQLGLTAITREGLACSVLYDLHLWEKSASPSLGKTLTLIRDTLQESPSPSPKGYEWKPGHKHYDSSLMNTHRTSDTIYQVRVIWNNGRSRVSFSGTRYQLVDQVSLFLMTGMNGATSRERSSRSSLKEALRSPSLDKSPDDTSQTSTSPTTKSLLHPIPHPVVALIVVPLLLVVAYLVQSMTN